MAIYLLHDPTAWLQLIGLGRTPHPSDCPWHLLSLELKLVVGAGGDRGRKTGSIRLGNGKWPCSPSHGGEKKKRVKKERVKAIAPGKAETRNVERESWEYLSQGNMAFILALFMVP